MATELLDLTHELEMARAPVHFQTQNFQFQVEFLLYLMLQAHGGLQVLGPYQSERQNLS